MQYLMGGVSQYGYPVVSPWQQVSNINMANDMLPGYARFNPAAIEGVATQRRNAFMRDFGNPYMSRVYAQNSKRSGDGVNSFAQQDNAFERAEMARQSENVYNEAKSDETGRIAALRNSYLGIPTTDSENAADAQYKAMVQEQELARQRRQDWLGPNGYIPRAADGLGGLAYGVANTFPNFGAGVGSFASGLMNGLLGR